MEYILAFKSANHAIKAEQCLLGQKLHPGVAPLPPQIGPGCGICLRVGRDELMPAIESLAGIGIDGYSVYLRDGASVMAVQI